MEITIKTLLSPLSVLAKIYLDRVDGHCYRHESTDHAKEKVIPFSLFDLIGVRVRYRTNQRRLRKNENFPQIVTDLIKASTKIIKNFTRIQNLTDDFFCTGDIQTIDYCLEVYRQYLDNEEFDPFLWNALKIKLTLKSLQPELEDFYKKNRKNFHTAF